jgi:arylformamidase
MKLVRIIDVSREINEGITVWPGDEPVRIEERASIEKGDRCNTHGIKTGLHVSTHLDTPLHFIRDGASLDRFDIASFCGRCKAFDMTGKKRITADDINNLDIEKDDIVLFKTDNSGISLDMPFEQGFVAIDETAAGYLVQKKIKALGIDYLSVEAFRSPGHRVHHMLLGEGIILVEGLDLSNADEGEYFITFFPLKIKGVEASPVRAVLMKFDV